MRHDFKVHDKVSQTRSDGTKDYGLIYAITDELMPISVRMLNGENSYISDYKPNELELEENTKPWQELLLDEDRIVRGHSGESYESFYIRQTRGGETRVMTSMDDGGVHSNLVERIEPFNMMFIQRYSTSDAVRRRKLISLMEKSGVA